MAILVSVLGLIVGMGVGYVTYRILSGLSIALRNSVRPWIYVTSLIWMAIAIFFIGLTVSNIGVWAIVIGLGVPLIGWSVTILGIVWSYVVREAVEHKFDRQLSSDPILADRLYSSRWLKWLMPKRKR